MSGEALWSKVVSGLAAGGEELQATTDLWFRLSSRGKDCILIVCY